MKYTFHPNFCSKIQGPRPFQPQITKIAKSGQKKPARHQISYFLSKKSGTLKFGIKVGVKSMFYLMTFFDSRPNNRAIDIFAFVAKVHYNSLEATEAPHFFHLGDF